MENVSVPNTGPLNDKNSAMLAAWNSAKAIKGESAAAAAEDRVDRVRESVFRNLAAGDAHQHPVCQRRACRGGVCPRSHAPLRHARLSRPDRPGRTRSAHELLDEGTRKHRYPGSQPARNARRRFEFAAISRPSREPHGRREGAADRSRTGVAAFVLPLEHHARRDAPAAGRPGEAARTGRAVRAGSPHDSGPQGLVVHRAVRRAVAGPRSPAARGRAQGQLPRLRR